MLDWVVGLVHTDSAGAMHCVRRLLRGARLHRGRLQRYDRALRIVADTRKASISFLQRKLKVGYNSAARLVERMEEEGIVGPSDGSSRPREIFIDSL